ncbi:MAG: A/G-specific adenine glycosylase [Bacteroidia bacterium]|nr:A/G-specific adenine glycosylase [Bacteroidia bacterium]
MNIKENDKLISRVLQNWYQKNKRHLPWRETPEAYFVWISEIILQQTRVNQGYNYFLRFTERFPDIKSLAEAPEDDVLKIWQGLGYYSRARNLHAAAKQIMEKFHGVFPTSYPDILSLKGIGEYTAAAVSSIVYNLPHPVVDGNVYRVLSRLFAIETPIDTHGGKKIFAEAAQSILDEQNPGTHNQAIMELGALVCTPQQPKCTECPLQPFCLALERKTPLAFPVKKGKTTQKERFFNYFHIQQNGFTYLIKRTKADIWKNLYEFPLIETNTQRDLLSLQSDDEFTRLFPSSANVFLTHKLRLRHVLSHRIIHADFYFVELDSKTVFDAGAKYLKIKSAELFKYPVSRLIHKYLETI